MTTTLQAASAAAGPGSTATSPPEQKLKKLRVVHGEVASVRAVPTREVSVITVEVPDDFHVEVTTMLYGKDVIVVCSELGGQFPYGVISPEEEPRHARSGQENRAAVARPPAQSGTIHGLISTIRPFPSRGVTQISVEIPILFHIDATLMLYGLNALVVPAKLPRNTPYGVLPPAPTESPAEAGAPTATSTHPAPTTRGGASTSASAGAARGQATEDGPREPVRLGLGRRSDHAIVATRWLGAKCAAAQFQDWLGVRTEAAARDRVCEMCGVDSRAEIQGSAKAMQAFIALIVQPFDAHMATEMASEGATAGAPLGIDEVAELEAQDAADRAAETSLRPGQPS